MKNTDIQEKITQLKNDMVTRFKMSEEEAVKMIQDFDTEVKIKSGYFEDSNFDDIEDLEDVSFEVFGKFADMKRYEFHLDEAARQSIPRYTEGVKEYLMETYGLTEAEAVEKIDGSSFAIMVHKAPMFTLLHHYSYWTKRMIENNKH